jgi:transposase
MGTRIFLCSIEMGRLQSMLSDYHTNQLPKKALPIMNITFPLYRAQRRRIEFRLKKTRVRIEALRCQILLLLSSGESPAQIHQRLGCARATIYRTIYRFEDLGEKSLFDQRCLSEPRKVTPDFLKRLLSLLDKSPQDQGWQRSTWSLELLALELHEQT